MEPASHKTFVVPQNTDRLIRALIAEGKGFNATTFSENEVERVMEIGADCSALVLRSGVKIPVMLSYEQLEQKIYQPDFKNDGPVLDLRDVTGAPANAGNTNMAAKAANAKPKTPANANEAPADPGETAKDGWYYAGLSEDPSSPKYHQPLWVAPKDAGIMKWDEADKTAAKLREKGEEARLPTRGELNQIFNALAKKDIGGFNRTGSNPAGWYWAAEHDDHYAACQQFSAGYPSYYLRSSRSSVRFVR